MLAPKSLMPKLCDVAGGKCNILMKIAGLQEMIVYRQTDTWTGC